MKRIVLCAFCAIAAALCSCARDPRALEAYALVMGISDYPLSELRLTYSANDARNVARAFSDAGYTTTLLLNEHATRETFETALSEIASSIDNNALFVFFYSGHGLSAETMRPARASFPDGGTHALLLYNAAAASASDVNAYADESLLTERALEALLSQLPTSQKVVILDACYSGGFVHSSTVHDFKRNAYLAESIAISPAEIISRAGKAYGEGFSLSEGMNGALVIAAAGAEELAWEPLYRHSVFTYFLLSAKDHADLNGDSYVSAFEIYLYTKAGIELHWNAHNASSMHFLPRISGALVDYLIF